MPCPLVKTAAAALLAIVPAGVAQACTVSPSVTTALGSFSPAAVNAAAVPALRSDAGLSCAPAVLVLLSGNYIKAKFTSANAMKLKKSTGETIAYAASADPGGSVPIAQNATVDYTQNNLLNVLGLLGGSNAVFPFYVKPSGGATPPVGRYTDRITVAWDWYLCQGLSALFACVGTPDKGTGTTIVDVTLDVTPKALILSTSAQTSWDPVNGTSRPKALPGSRRRWTVTVQNPDLVPADTDTVAVTIPVAARETVALDGDGTGSGTVVGFADGSPASGLSASYAGPASTTDQVDFSTDGGASWTYVPVAADAASVARVNAVRVRTRGRMAAGSQFSVSIPTLMR